VALLAATAACDGISDIGESRHTCIKALARCPPPENNRELSAVDLVPPAEWDRPAAGVTSVANWEPWRLRCAFAEWGDAADSTLRVGKIFLHVGSIGRCSHVFGL